MQGDPRHFESLVTRLGFQIEADGPERASWVWRGGRFPGFLCLGIAGALLILSIPVLEAIRSQGWGSPAAYLWYFPVMNLILFCVGAFLLSLKRSILMDQRSRRVRISKRSLWNHREIVIGFAEIDGLQIGTDLVYSGPALAGSTVGQRFFPATSLRLVLADGATVLLDRGGKGRIRDLALRLKEILHKPVFESEKISSHT